MSATTCAETSGAQTTFQYMMFSILFILFEIVFFTLFIGLMQILIDLMEFKVGLSSLDKRKIKKLQKQLEDLEDLDSKQALEQYKKQKKTRREEIKLKLEALNESIKKIEILFASGNFSSRNEHGQCLKEKEELLDELDFLKFCSQPEPTESAYNKSINICINPINKVKKTISNRIKRIENIIYWNVVWAPEVSAQVVADMISKAVINIRGKGDKDPFWDISSKDLIRVFVLCLRKIYKNEYFTLDDMNYFFDAENDLMLIIILLITKLVLSMLNHENYCEKKSRKKLKSMKKNKRRKKCHHKFYQKSSKS